MENKRGQGLSTNAIILIILGVVILVILIIGFSVGWSTLVPFLRSDNVDTVVKSCDTSCSTQSKFSYCSEPKDLSSKILKVTATCNVLEKVYPELGIAPCNIDCGVICTNLEIDSKKGTVVTATACPTGQKDVSKAATGLQTGQLCCI